MGPRSCERGNGLVKEVRQEFHFASMGPRSCERGNRACAAESARIERSFNGAALVRARKSRLSADRTVVLLLLQWGRARASAEIPRRGRASGQRLRGASMGPRSCERGNVVARESLLDRAELQWGRARASAEMVCSQTRTSRACRCFNGAALVRARKCIRRRAPPLPPRRFNGAALVRARKYGWRSGGKDCQGTGFNGAALVRARKWGRRRAPPLPPRRFNGAALVRARKYGW